MIREGSKHNVRIMIEVVYDPPPHCPTTNGRQDVLMGHVRLIIWFTVSSVFIVHRTVPGGLLVVENLIFTSDGSHEDPADLKT